MAETTPDASDSMITCAGEAVEQPQVVGREPRALVDPLPVVEHAVGVVDRRLAPQLVRHGKPAGGQELRHRARLGDGRLHVHVRFADVAVQGVDTLEDVLRALSRDRSLDLAEARLVRVHKVAERAVRKRHWNA
eukprot:5937896-Pleurochrysis_carterae.AAC.6